MRFRKFVKDPLVHFIIAGAVLFVILGAVNPVKDSSHIVVDRTALLSFIQYRNKAFERHAAEGFLDAMSDEERERAIQDYIREEALYREAKKLALDQGDYVIRRRMVQKLEFMTESAVPPPEPDDEALNAYYEQNKDDYYQQPGATFTHVFVSRAKNDQSTILAARALLTKLRADHAGYKDATHYGDRFLFHTNYVDRTYDYIKSHFGSEATEIIFSDDTKLSKWTGPVISTYGAHLIFVTKRTQGRIPAFSEIKSKIAEDYARAKQRERMETLINAIVETYSPVIRLDEQKKLKSKDSEQ